jgi:hypothetical protein
MKRFMNFQILTDRFAQIIDPSAASVKFYRRD